MTIITFTGPSGAGKSTILRELLKDDMYYIVPNHTTRAKRDTDLPGEFNYLAHDEFDDISSGCIWQVVFAGNRYGTLFASLDEALDTKRYGMMVLVPEVYSKLWAYTKGKLIPIFLLPPSQEELQRRMEERGDAPEVVAKRLKASLNWEAWARQSEIPFVFIRGEGHVPDIVDQVTKAIKTYKQ